VSTHTPPTKAKHACSQTASPGHTGVQDERTLQKLQETLTHGKGGDGRGMVLGKKKITALPMKKDKRSTNIEKGKKKAVRADKGCHYITRYTSSLGRRDGC